MGTTTALVTFPAASALLSSIGFYSSPFFDALLPIALVITGIVVGGLLVVALLTWFVRIFYMIIDRKNRDYYDDERGYR